LAVAGYDITQNPPPRPNGKKPDYLIAGTDVDCAHGMTSGPTTSSTRSLSPMCVVRCGSTTPRPDLDKTGEEGNPAVNRSQDAPTFGKFPLRPATFEGCHPPNGRP
jgi:hypothetical protein